MAGALRKPSILALVLALLLAVLGGADAFNKCVHDTTNDLSSQRWSCRTKWHASLKRHVNVCTRPRDGGGAFAYDAPGPRTIIVYGVAAGGKSPGNSCRCCSKNPGGGPQCRRASNC